MVLLFLDPFLPDSPQLCIFFPLCDQVSGLFEGQTFLHTPYSFIAWPSPGTESTWTRLRGGYGQNSWDEAPSGSEATDKSLDLSVK